MEIVGTRIVYAISSTFRTSCNDCNSLFATCGGGGSGGESAAPKTSAPEPVVYDVQGVGVKGPLQHAEVVLYRLDLTAEDGHGEELGRGTTNQQAQLEGISLSGEPEGNFLLEFNATQGTTDLTTGQAPVISRLSTIIDAEAIMAGDAFYATPLSTLAVLLVLERDPAGNELAEAMTVAQQDVKSIVGLDASVDLFTTPPLLTESADTPDANSQLVRLRVAIEGIAAIVYNLQNAGDNDEVSSTEIMAALASDLADGVINAESNGEPILVYDAGSLDVFLQPLRELILPNTAGKSTEDVVAILVEETQSLGNSHLDTTTLAEQASKPWGPYFMRTVDTDDDGISEDDGKTWRTISVLDYGNPGAKLTESSSGELIMLQKCDYSLCLFRSHNGTTWSKHDLFSASDFLDCYRKTCDPNKVSPNSIIETEDGSFAVSFSHDAGLGLEHDVYVTTTHDFSYWSTPTRITSGNGWEFGSSLVQLSDGTFVLALVSYVSDSIEIYSSVDGLNWPYSTRITTSVWAHMRLNWLVEGDQARLFFASDNKLYSSIKVGQHFYETAPVNTSDKPFGGEALRFPDGSIGLTFTLDLNNQRDVFFTNLGKL